MGRDKNEICFQNNQISFKENSISLFKQLFTLFYVFCCTVCPFLQMKIYNNFFTEVHSAPAAIPTKYEPLLWDILTITHNFYWNLYQIPVQF